MILAKVREDQRRSNRAEMGKYDNYVAVDWSINNMAVAVMKRGSTQLRVADIPTSTIELKRYLKGLPGRTVVTFEESTGAHWLYLELREVVDRVLVCDPFKNKLLSDGPKNEETKAAYDGEFEKRCKRNRSLKALSSLDGIGPIRAAKILATVIEPRRFATTGKYLAYCGLVRVEKTSGKRKYGTRKPHYSRMLKGVYNGAAMTTINGNGPIREYYDYLLSKGVAEHNARNAIARYIARLSLGILKSNEKYEPYRWRKNLTSRGVNIKK